MTSKFRGRHDSYWGPNGLRKIRLPVGPVIYEVTPPKQQQQNNFHFVWSCFIYCAYVVLSTSMVKTVEGEGKHWEGLQSIFVMCFEVRSVLLSPPPLRICICLSCFPFPILSQCLQLSHLHRIHHKHYYYYVFDFVCGRNGQLPSVAEWSNCLCITVCTFLRSAATAAHCHSFPDWTSCNWKVFIQPVCF